MVISLSDVFALLLLLPLLLWLMLLTPVWLREEEKDGETDAADRGDAISYQSAPFVAD